MPLTHTCLLLLSVIFVSVLCKEADLQKEISWTARDVKDLLARKGYHISDPSGIMLDRYYLDNRMSDKPALVQRRVDGDSMMLYSISEKKYVQFNQEKISGNRKVKSLSTGSGINGSDQNKMFITETVSFGFFKIKLEGRDQYLCAKNNGGITFKDEALVPDRSRIRRRCLFHWEFTKQMHVRLSLSFDNVTRHLFARDGHVMLGLTNETSEIEQSFIWLPTFGRQVRKSLSTKTPSSNARSADDTASGSDRVNEDADVDDDDSEEDECDSWDLRRVNEDYKKQIADLKKQLKEAKFQYADYVRKDAAKKWAKTGKS